jgi:tetratricopeptide (TPR) repeat protein
LGYNAFCNWGNYGYGLGYGGYGLGYTTYDYAPTVVAQSPIVAEEALQLASADAGDSEQFAAEGDASFKAGDYQAAARAWRHALVDDPENGTLVMLMAQALFASGSFDQAAGATQQAMMMLPEDQWGVVVSNYAELYPNVGDYTKQLRALEKSVRERPEDPALRFLTGFHYGYLGYPDDAVVQLAKVKKLAPQDQAAAKLYDVLAAKSKKPPAVEAVPAPKAESPPAAEAPPATN